MDSLNRGALIARRMPKIATVARVPTRLNPRRP
jgi:hypothetical protein